MKERGSVVVDTGSVSVDITMRGRGGAGRGSKNQKRRLKTSETVTPPGKLLIYNLTTISILISVTGLKTLL